MADGLKRTLDNSGVGLNPTGGFGLPPLSPNSFIPVKSRCLGGGKDLSRFCWGAGGGGDGGWGGGGGGGGAGRGGEERVRIILPRTERMYNNDMLKSGQKRKLGWGGLLVQADKGGFKGGFQKTKRKM